MNKQIKAVIVGAGHRGLLYASYALKNSDAFIITGVVDPDAERRARAAEIHRLGEEHCFSSLDGFLKSPKTADAAINATMDSIHIETSLPLLEHGYHLLLEKPVSTNSEGLKLLAETAKKFNRKVMVCHVLRYAPFYAKIKEKILAGEIGDIVHISTGERVSYHHASVGYIRGKWNRRDACGSTIMMAKCSHDLDIICWLKSGVSPTRVASMGGNYQFVPEKAPTGAGTRCLSDCPVEASCMYSARKIYIDHPGRWSFYVWSQYGDRADLSVEQMEQSLKTDNPHGRCIYKCGSDTEDHQTVLISFEDGTTAQHQLTTGTARPGRPIYIAGTRGEIEGFMEDGYFYLRTPDTRPGKEHSCQRISCGVDGDAHGGGDMRLVEDFVSVLNGGDPSISTTDIVDSVNGHMVGFMAEIAKNKRGEVEL